MAPPTSFGFTTDFQLGSLSVPVTLKVDTPVVKKRLLFDIVENLKKGEDPYENRRGFKWDYESAFESLGEQIFNCPAEEPEFESISEDYEDVLKILNAIWNQEYPDGSPKEIRFTIDLELTTEKLTRGLAFAWSDEELQAEGVTEISSEQISAYDVIYWTVHVYIYHGQWEFDDAEFYEEPYRLCEEVVKHWFGFLDDKFEYGCWDMFISSTPTAEHAGDGKPDPALS